jgi:hypothetical protein
LYISVKEEHMIFPLDGFFPFFLANKELMRRGGGRGGGGRVAERGREGS